MKHQKFLNKISFYSTVELTDFTNFLSYYFPNKEIILEKTIQLLIKIHPDYTNKYDEQKLYKKVFNDENIDINKLNKIFTTLNKAFDQFIIYRQIQKNDIEQQLLKLMSSIDVKDVKTYDDEKINLEKTILNITKRNDETFRLEYLLHNLNYKHQIVNDQRKGDLNIQKLADSFDKYWVTRKLEIYLVMLSRKQMFNVDFKNHFIEDLLIKIPQTNLIHEPVIALLIKTIQLYLQPIEKDYLLFLDLLKKYQNNFTSSDLRSYYSAAENIVSLIYKKGTHIPALFKLYEIQQKLGILNLNNTIQAPLFNNIVTIGLRLNKHSWVKDFIESNKKFLPKEYYLDYYTFNNARFLFAQKQYAQILKEVQDIEYKNVEIKLGIKRLLAKTFYEMNELQLLEHHLNSLKVFLPRHAELSEVHQEMHKYYLKHFYKLHKIALDPNRKGAQKFLQVLEKADQLIDKNWMIEKLNQMKIN